MTKDPTGQSVLAALATAVVTFLTGTDAAPAPEPQTDTGGAPRGGGGSKRPPECRDNSSGLPDEPDALDAYQVGTWKQLTDASDTFDGLQIHHALQDLAAQQLIPGAEYNTGPAIALPDAEHRRIPNLKGNVSLTPRQVMARDARNLRKFTNAPNSAIQKLINLNKCSYPEAFQK